MKKLSIIIPVFNEAETIQKILRFIEVVPIDWTKEIIVVDDGSTDGTADILDKLKQAQSFIYVKHTKNFGKGKAIRTALKYATGDAIIIQDADLEYDPFDYQKLLAEFEKGNPVVYGSRNLDKKTERGYFFYSLGGRLITAVCNLLFGSHLTDINTGYKLFDSGIIKNINLEKDGFEFCEEVTVKILRKGIAIKEVPINYYPRSFKEGKKIKIKDGFKAISTLITYRFFKKSYNKD